jgi:YesN/AraC family two-component response regulator
MFGQSERNLNLAKGKKILIVEDNRVDRNILRSMLKVYFDVIVLAKDGVDALKRYQDERFDIVLTDLMMPNMDGVELIKRIKEINKSQHIAVISSSNDSNRLIELIDLEINTFILKPLNKEMILKKVSRLLENIYYRREMEKLAFKEYLFNVLNKDGSSEKLEKLQNRQSIDTLRLQNSLKGDFAISNNSDVNISYALQSDLVFLSSSIEDDLNLMIFEGITTPILHEMSSKFRQIGNVLSELDEFKDTSSAFFDLGKLIYTHKDIDEKKPFELIELLWVDIDEFLFGILVEKRVDKISYFTKSLTSNIENLRSLLEDMDCLC